MNCMICYGCSHFGSRTSLMQKQNEGQKAPPSVFWIFEMENHILWIYLGIKLIEIDTYDAYNTLLVIFEN